MIKIGVLSDTHIRDAGHGIAFLNDLCDYYFNDVEIIFHAGDIVNPDILMGLGDRQVHAVRGNMDRAVVSLPDTKVLEVGGFRFGLAHGWGAPTGLERRLLREFQGQNIDCLVYGHTHVPVCHTREGVLFFNPGSATDRRSAPWHSIGIIEVGETIEGRIIRIDP